jgi:hypothetical protein
MLGLSVNNEYERMRKEPVVANFNLLPRYLPGVTEEETMNLSHETDFPPEILELHYKQNGGMFFSKCYLLPGGN